MKNKYRKYRKYVFFLDRFPYIVFLIVAGLTVWLFMNIDQRLDLSFFSPQERQAAAVSSEVVVTSPAEDQVFNLRHRETVPIEVRASDIEDVESVVIVSIDGQVVQIFTDPPYAFEWEPEDEGEYMLDVEAADMDERTIGSSDTVTFRVNFVSPGW